MTKQISVIKKKISKMISNFLTEIISKKKMAQFYAEGVEKIQITLENLQSSKREKC